MFSIKSTLSSRELIFNNLNNEYFRVTFGGDVNASLNVYTYTDGNGISLLFSELASFEKPWAGEKRWESIERDFSISVSCSALGKVLIKARITDPSEEALTMEISLVTEFSQLIQIAKDAKALL